VPPQKRRSRILWIRLLNQAPNGTSGTRGPGPIVDEVCESELLPPLRANRMDIDGRWRLRG